MPAGLSARLRQETSALHARVEGSRFMRVLLAGQMGQSAYALLLRNLHPLYLALEAGLQRHRGDPCIAPIFMPTLARSGALARDLQSLHGPSWSLDLIQLPAGRAYEERLFGLADETPEALLAHAYVRYLGDLSGGQLLRAVVLRNISSPTKTGTAFYDFGEPTEAAALALRFRSGLDQAELNPAASDAVVAEACLAFEMHGRLFDELAHVSQLAPTSAMELG